ncbi:maltose ABC transporter substrate-binding protein [Glycomyces sp. TRM65418]|uniref:sugar ABC transporter substrate-binding protein n=1 Tax=Glycomyces sp. TRM65418 TaxID=2867006 RepID=UPI001CE4FFD3|nr:maltose ABC transporter substrate-binding protein [Glycomyces sp. TRM65418]MCC3764606.1 maltose ABC transporter substrate-binding protein [Glycomyces sp. TRM65418]QZD54270.1 maltose ABC transporter substrate-binding protein [Glycomyces sp. TRM65418]
MRRRTLGITAVSAAALGAAAACGSDDGDASSEETSQFSGELVIWADETRTPVLKEFVKDFESQVGVKVTVEEHVETLREDFLTAAEQGQGPDIVVGAHDWAGQYAAAGAIAPITLSADKQGTLNETSVKAFTVDGNVYGVPYAMENLGLIRNTDLAPAAPTTFEELIAAGRAAGTDEVLTMEVGVDGNAYSAYPLFASMGGYLFKDDGAGNLDPTDVGVDSPGGVAAFEKFAELGADGVLKTTIDASNTIPFFVDGKTAFMISGPWALVDVQGAGLNYEVTAIPGFEGQGPASPFLGVQGFYVSATAKNAVFAQEFVTNYVLTEDLQRSLAEAGGRLPALTAAAEAFSAGNADIQGFAAAGESAVPMPNIPAMNAVWEPFGRAEADAIDGVATGAEAAGTAAQAIRDAVASS